MPDSTDNEHRDEEHDVTVNYSTDVNTMRVEVDGVVYTLDVPPTRWVYLTVERDAGGKVTRVYLRGGHP